MSSLPERLDPETALEPQPLWRTARLDDGNQTRPLHPYEMECLEDARAKGLYTSLCPGCDGPRATSQMRPLVMCYGCGKRWDSATVASRKGWPLCTVPRSNFAERRRCDRCPKRLTPDRRERCLPCAMRGYKALQASKKRAR